MLGASSGVPCSGRAACSVWTALGDPLSLQPSLPTCLILRSPAGRAADHPPRARRPPAPRCCRCQTSSGGGSPLSLNEDVLRLLVHGVLHGPSLTCFCGFGTISSPSITNAVHEMMSSLSTSGRLPAGVSRAPSDCCLCLSPCVGHLPASPSAWPGGPPRGLLRRARPSSSLSVPIARARVLYIYNDI